MKTKATMTIWKPFAEGTDMAELIILTPELVNSTFADCLAPKYKRVERVRVTVGATSAVFDKAKLVEHHPTILLMLSDLPTEFRPKKQGGSNGWTLRNACMNKNKVQWTKLMVEVERLLALGMASGWVMLHNTKGVVSSDTYATIELPVPADSDL